MGFVREPVRFQRRILASEKGVCDFALVMTNPPQRVANGVYNPPHSYSPLHTRIYEEDTVKKSMVLLAAAAIVTMGWSIGRVQGESKTKLISISLL